MNESPNLFSSLLGAAGTVFSSVQNTKTAQANAKAQQAQAAQASNTTRLLLIGGGLLAVVVVLVMVFRSK